MGGPDAIWRGGADEIQPGNAVSPQNQIQAGLEKGGEARLHDMIIKGQAFKFGWIRGRELAPGRAGNGSALLPQGLARQFLLLLRNLLSCVVVYR